MNWSNVLLIWRREIRDQLRDRRTLFMVAVLPVLMYPLLGTSFFQLAQFLRETTGAVAVYGAEQVDTLPEAPTLFDEDGFAPALFNEPADAARLRVERREADDAVDVARAAIGAGQIDVAVVFPDDFASRLEAMREDPSARDSAAPQPMVLYNSARDQSQVAGLRVNEVMRRWRRALIRQNLAASGVPEVATSPFRLEQMDVATREGRDALLWSKLLPFIVFLWALTGAFYPAIDLCAGEKERGTLETLLASPARRSEIVGGKLLTVMTFSLFTAMLNLASLALTTKVLVSQLGGVLGPMSSLAPPPMSAIAWILVASLPVAALFSALSLACAAYAKSTKEGQYYFMPLFLGATPLMLVPLSPGVELNLGNSLVPVMGLVLLLRSLIEGQLVAAATHALPVVAVTGVCVWLAMRWAVSQFNQESVLFRESERFDPIAQLRSMVRRRGETPSPSAAIACVGLIFGMQWLIRFVIPAPTPEWSGFGYFATLVVISQVVCIAAPAVLIVVWLTRSWRKSFRLDQAPSVADAALAVAAAATIHPLGQKLALWIKDLYPLSDAVQAQLEGLGGLVGDAPHIGWVLLLMAALPAICEELAFRGVVLSGLRKNLGPSAGVLLTAVLFGATHTVLQQSLAAAPVGVVLGVIALRTGSLVPCVLFHATYNAMQLLAAIPDSPIRALADRIGVMDLVFVEIEPGQLGYATPIAMLGGVAAACLILRMGRRERGAPHPAAVLETAV